MTDMGQHSATVNGRRGEDGAAAVPAIKPLAISPAFQVQRLAPLPPIRPADESITAEVTEAVRDAIDGDKVIRWLAASVVLAVAAFAAIVSYSHIFELGTHHGQDGTAARLLPLSVDGLIAAASLVMLHAARNKLDVPWLARAMLALGVAATVAANVEYGLPFGWLAAVVSAWPAVAFVGSVEMAVRFVRDARHVATSGQQDDAPDDDSADDTEDDSPPPPPPPDDDKKDDKPKPRTPSGRARALAILRRNPGLSDADAAKRAKVSLRTVQRARSELAKAAL